MTVAISKQLSYVLRHRPDAIGIALDRAGWVAVDELLAALARHGTALGRAELEAIVEGSDKRRFALSPDGRRIRAQQGHSVPVELGHAPAAPPAILYHAPSSASCRRSASAAWCAASGITCICPRRARPRPRSEAAAAGR